MMMGAAALQTDDEWILSLFSGGKSGAWYDFTDTTTMFVSNGGAQVSLDGQSVGYVLDKSGNGNHITKDAAYSAPIFRTSGIKKWLEFSGNNVLSRTGNAIGCANAFVACVINGYGVNGYAGVVTNPLDQATFVDFAFNASSASSEMDAGQGVGAGLGASGSFWKNGALSNAVTLGYDAVYSANGSTHPSSTLIFPNGVMIGNDRSNPSRQLTGRVYGVLLIGSDRAADILGAADRNRIESYIAKF